MTDHRARGEPLLPAERRPAAAALGSKGLLDNAWRANLNVVDFHLALAN